MLSQRFGTSCYARFLSALLSVALGVGPSSAYALRQPTVEGAGLEELQRALAPAAGLEGDVPLAHLVAALATGRSEVVERVATVIGTGQGLQATLDQVPVPRDYWAGVIEDFITAQFPDPDRPMAELVSNAVDAVNKGRFPKDVTVTLKPGRFVIQDQGVGMTREQILRQLLIPTISGSASQTQLIGRFGVGFYSAMSYLRQPLDRLIVETSDGTQAHRVTFRRDGAGVHVAITPQPSGPRGTTVTITSRRLDDRRVQRATAFIRGTLRFLPGQRAAIRVNGQQINGLGGLLAIDAPGGVSIFYSDTTSANGNGFVVATVNGMTILRLPVTGYRVPKVTIVDFPPTTPLPVTRNTIDVTPATVASTKHAIDVIMGLPDELLLWSALYPLVQRIQRGNPSRLPADDVERYLRQRIQQRLRPGRRYAPDDAAGQVLSVTRDVQFLHPALLIPEILGAWERFPGVETDTPVVLADMKDPNQVLAVSGRVIFWNNRYAPHTPLQEVLGRLRLALHGIHVSPARPSAAVPAAPPRSPIVSAPAPVVPMTDLQARERQFLDLLQAGDFHEFRPTGIPADDQYVAELTLTTSEARQFLREVPPQTFQALMTIVDGWDDPVTAGRILRTLLATKREYTRAAARGVEDPGWARAFPSWQVWHPEGVRRALETGWRTLREFPQWFEGPDTTAQLAPFTSELRDMMALALIAHQREDAVGHLALVEVEKFFDFSSRPMISDGESASSWMYLVGSLLVKEEGRALLLDNTLREWFIAQWLALFADDPSRFLEAAWSFQLSNLWPAVPGALGERFPATMRTLQARGVTPQQFGEFFVIFNEFTHLPQVADEIISQIDREAFVTRYAELWLNELHGLLALPAESAQDVIHDLQHLRVSTGDPGERRPSITRLARPYVTFVLGTQTAIAGGEVISMAHGPVDVSLPLSRLVGRFLQGERTPTSIGQARTMLKRLVREASPETIEIATRAIHHTVNFQSSVPYIFLRELIQNAADEAEVTQAPMERRRLEVTAGPTTGNRLVLTVQDHFGMNLARLLDVLLIPGATTKKGGVAQIGEFGQGFFTIFKEAEVVHLKTAVSPRQTIYVRLTPQRNADGHVVDIQLELALRQEATEPGTTIQWIKPTKSVEMEAAFLKAFATTYAGLVDPALLTVLWGGEPLNQALQRIAEGPSPYGIIYLYVAPGENTVTHRGLYIKELDLQEYLAAAPEIARQVLLRYGMVLELPPEVRLIKDRTDVADKPMVLRQLRPIVGRMALEGVIHLFASGTLQLDLLPYDYLTDFARYAVPASVTADAMALVQDQSVDLRPYADQTRLGQLLVVLPIFPVRNQAASQSFQAILRGLRAGELEAEDLPPAVAQHIIGQWRVHAVEQAFFRGEQPGARRPAATGPKPLRMEDRRLGEPPDPQAEALWAFRDLTEELTRTLTEAGGGPQRTIAQTFYQHAGGDLAHAVQGGGAIGWNLHWWRSALATLAQALSTPEGHASPGMQEWLVHYLDTLTHEMVHILEGSDDWTHHADFTAKQQQLVEFLVRSSEIVETRVAEILGRYQGTLPRGSLDRYVLGRSNFVDLAEPLRTGLEEPRLTEALAAFAEATHGPGVVVVEQGVLAQRAGLEELVKRLPPGLAERVVVFRDGDMSSLAATLMASPYADRVTYVGLEERAVALQSMLPTSMTVSYLPSQAGLKQIVQALGVPYGVVEQLLPAGLEESLALGRAA